MNKQFTLKNLLVACAASWFFLPATAQIGLSVSPPRVYYELDPGQTASQKIVVNNESKNATLNLAVTFEDWKYDELGNNVMFPPDSLSISCANWMTLSQNDTYIALKPGESKTIELIMNVPPDIGSEQNVHTAMCYLTQMNQTEDVDAMGAAIYVNVRSGIKIYQKSRRTETRKIEIENLRFNKEKNALELTFSNKGNVWINGDVNSSLFNLSNGKETNLEPVIFYTLPGDRRILYIPVKKEQEKGRFTATVMIDYDDDSSIEAAELQFNHE